MNHAELVAAVHAEIQQDRALTKADVAAVLGAMSNVVTTELSQGDEIALKDLGKLSIKQKPARTGRNPKTGEAMQIPAKTVPHFSAAKALKDAVNQ